MTSKTDFARKLVPIQQTQLFAVWDCKGWSRTCCGKVPNLWLSCWGPRPGNNQWQSWCRHSKSSWNKCTKNASVYNDNVHKTIWFTFWNFEQVLLKFKNAIFLVEGYCYQHPFHLLGGSYDFRRGLRENFIVSYMYIQLHKLQAYTLPDSLLFTKQLLRLKVVPRQNSSVFVFRLFPTGI